MMHAIHSKSGSLATLISLGSIPLARERITRMCTAAVTRLGIETVEGTVNSFAAHLESELAL